MLESTPALNSSIKGSHRICVVYADRPAGRDGIRDFSEALAAALNEVSGVDGRLGLWDRSMGLPTTALDATSIVLQYNPFSYGRGGFAPSLLVQLRRRAGPALCVMVHEPYIPITGGWSALMGVWQRFQLRGLLNMADAVGLSAEGFRDYLPVRHRGRATHMAVGSPLPDARSRRSEARAGLGVEKSGLVIAIYGSSHPSRIIGHCVAAVQGLVGAGLPPVVLNLGSTAPSLAALPSSVRVIRPGPLPASDLAALLASADIALLPFVDGASTRRTSLIAALQQETCVISTLGPLTDREFALAPSPVLTPVDDLASFVTATIDLAGDATRRERCASQGRKLFEEHFEWRVIAQRLLAALPTPPAR